MTHDPRPFGRLLTAMVTPFTADGSLDLEGAAHEFERWKCPNCRQVIGIDRDPQVGGRFQLARGQPWNYSPEVYKR